MDIQALERVINLESLQPTASHQLAAFKVPFVVPTPKAYIVDLALGWDTVEQQNASRRKLLRKVDGLYQILEALNIPLEKAIESDYTLNRGTHDELSRIALYEQNNKAALELLAEYAF